MREAAETCPNTVDIFREMEGKCINMAWEGMEAIGGLTVERVEHKAVFLRSGSTLMGSNGEKND